MLNLRSELLALFDSLNCAHYERNGDVWVLTPENLLYRLSLPQQMTGQFLSPDLHEWVIQAVRDGEIRGCNIGSPDDLEETMDGFLDELENR